jgi:hypothetical protein
MEPGARVAKVEPLFVLSLMMGLVATGYLWRRDRRALPPRSARERGPRSLRPGDVLQILGDDLVVEAVSRLEETGRARLLCRLSGGRHLWVRSPDPPDPDDELWLLRPAPYEGGAGEVLAAGGLRYRLSGRFPVEAAFSLGPPEPGPPAPPPERVLEYRGVGAARLLVILGEEHGAAYAGAAVPADRVSLLLGS